MNRYIFRGRRQDNGEWVEGHLIWYEDGRARIVPRHTDIFCYSNNENLIQTTAYEVIPETVGQYTGLNDKNGKKIFEGDIVHYLYEPGKGKWNCDQHSVIEWNSTGFYMRGIMGTNKYACSMGWLVSIPHGNGKCFEVIGNIHDHPELLGGFENATDRC